MSGDTPAPASTEEKSFPPFLQEQTMRTQRGCFSATARLPSSGGFKIRQLNCKFANLSAVGSEAFPTSVISSGSVDNG